MFRGAWGKWGQTGPGADAWLTSVLTSGSFHLAPSSPALLVGAEASDYTELETRLPSFLRDPKFPWEPLPEIRGSSAWGWGPPSGLCGGRGAHGRAAAWVSTASAGFSPNRQK